MSSTQLLRPGNYADGARVVSTTVRPVRQACLIAEDDPSMAARFAESRSLAWGGHIGYVLPYSRSEGLREPWRRLLDLLDPDQVFALGMSDDLVVSQDLGRMVYTRYKPEELLILGSTLMYSVLNAVGQSLKPPDSEWFVVVPKLSQWSSFCLPLMARYGGVNEAELESILNQMYSHRGTFNLDLNKSVRVEEVSVTENLLGMLTGDVSGLLNDDVRDHALTLPQLTLSGLQPTGRPSPLRRQNPADGREWGPSRPIVVTGSDDSVEDFALFWNLRSEHYFARPFPMWIPIDLLEDAEAPAAIEEALERVPRVAGQASRGWTTS